jgi:hypothetical protein
MIYPATLASLPSSPFHILAEYQGNRYYVQGAQTIFEAITIRDRCSKDHPEVVFLAFIGTGDLAIDGDWQQHNPIIVELVGPAAA